MVLGCISSPTKFEYCLCMILSHVAWLSTLDKVAANTFAILLAPMLDGLTVHNTRVKRQLRLKQSRQAPRRIVETKLTRLQSLVIGSIPRVEFGLFVSMIIFVVPTATHWMDARVRL